MIKVFDNVKVQAVASYLPEKVFEMSSLYERFGEHYMKNAMKATGVERVRIAEPDVTSSDMCYEAAKFLLDKEGVDKSEIDGLIMNSQTHDYILPPTAVILQDRLGLSRDIIAQDMNFGCSGYVLSLLQAAVWISSGLCGKVLVLNGETITRRVNPEDRASVVLFGEAGSATLMTKGEGSIAFKVYTDGSGWDKLYIPAGLFRMPASEKTKDLVYDANGNGRALEDMYMDGEAIFSFVISKVPGEIKELLSAVKWTKDEVGLFAFHQPNEIMIKFLAKLMKVPSEKMPVNVKNYGNTSSTSIHLLLTDLLPGEGDCNLDKVVLSGFGVGLSIASAALDMSGTRFYPPLNK